MNQSIQNFKPKQFLVADAYTIAESCLNLKTDLSYLSEDDFYLESSALVSLYEDSKKLLSQVEDEAASLVKEIDDRCVLMCVDTDTDGTVYIDRCKIIAKELINCYKLLLAFWEYRKTRPKPIVRHWWSYPEFQEGVRVEMLYNPLLCTITNYVHNLHNNLLLNLVEGHYEQQKDEIFELADRYEEVLKHLQESIKTLQQVEGDASVENRTNIEELQLLTYGSLTTAYELLSEKQHISKRILNPGEYDAT